MGGAPLGAAPRGTTACSGGTPPRGLRKDANIRPGLVDRAETIDSRSEWMDRVTYSISSFYTCGFQSITRHYCLDSVIDIQDCLRKLEYCDKVLYFL